MEHTNTIRIASLQTEKATIVALQHGEHTFSGTAVKHKSDPFNPDVGYELALSRALAKAQRFYEKRASSIVSQVDNDKLQRGEVKIVWKLKD